MLATSQIRCAMRCVQQTARENMLPNQDLYDSSSNRSVWQLAQCLFG